MAPATDLETWHALDAPFTDLDDWLDDLETGVCTACSGEALRGELRWWHDDGARRCPARHKRRPTFSADPVDPDD